MFQTGIDSMALEKEFVPLDKYLDGKPNEPTTNEKPIVLKALVGASVTTEDQNFDEHYQTVIKNIFDKYKIRQEKIIYQRRTYFKANNVKI